MQGTLTVRRWFLPPRGTFDTWRALATLFLLLGAPMPVFGATFTAALDRDTLTVGESATLSLAFTGGQPGRVPAVPNIPNLNVAYVGPSSQFSYINGQVSSSVTYNFTLTPTKPGNYAIPALTAEVGGETLTSPPLLLKVTAPAAPSPQAINSGSQPAFLKLLLPKRQVYVGESFTIQAQLHVLSQIPRVSNFSFTAIPAEGFNVGKMAQGQQRQVQLGSAVYTIVPVSIALQAVKAGHLTLGPITASIVLSSRDPFDPFNMFGGGEQKHLALATEAETISSLPLPQQNVPENFNGAVGTYTMNLTAGPTNVGVGDPITVRVQISGRGSLESLQLPEQPAWHDFKTYPPTAKVDTADQLGLQGTKTFEQIVQPENVDLKALPSFSFSFFDPDQKAYRTLSEPALPLVVRPAGAASAPTVLASTRPQENAPAGPELVPNKQRLGELAQLGPPLARQAWFLTLQGVPLAAFVSLVAWRRRTDNLANNPRLRRRRQVAQLVRQGLVELRHLAQEKKSDEFFAALFRLLQEQLGERLDVPASAITEAVVEERLRPQGVPEEVLSGLQELFQACNLARYAPVKSSQELAAVIPKAEKTLDELQALKL